MALDGDDLGVQELESGNFPTFLDDLQIVRTCKG